MRIITKILKPINKHHPKAQSVFIPEKIDYNTWQTYIKDSLKVAKTSKN